MKIPIDYAEHVITYGHQTARILNHKKYSGNDAGSYHGLLLPIGEETLDVASSR